DIASDELEDPQSTMVIAIVDAEDTFVNPSSTYAKKAEVGFGKILRTMSQIFVGVSDSQFYIVNANISERVFPKSELKYGIRNALIPKLYAPIRPLLMSTFDVTE